MLSYFAITVLSLCSCFVGFVLESTEGNIGHVQNGRKPNAGAAILPTIPMVQIFYALATWGLNWFQDNAGFWVVTLYALSSIGIRLLSYKNKSAQLRVLLETHTSHNETIPK